MKLIFKVVLFFFLQIGFSEVKAQNRYLETAIPILEYFAGIHDSVDIHIYEFGEEIALIGSMEAHDLIYTGQMKDTIYYLDTSINAKPGKPYPIVNGQYEVPAKVKIRYPCKHLFPDSADKVQLDKIITNRPRSRVKSRMSIRLSEVYEVNKETFLEIYYQVSACLGYSKTYRMDAKGEIDLLNSSEIFDYGGGCN